MREGRPAKRVYRATERGRMLPPAQQLPTGRLSMNNAELLKSMDVFAQVSDKDLEKIAALLRERRVPRDTTLFRQGDIGDSLCIVVSGRMKSATTDSTGREKVLGYYTEEQYFGEMSVLTGEPRASTVQATVDSKLLVLRKEDLDAFLGQNVAVMLQTMKVIAQRQAAVAQQRQAATPGPARVEQTPIAERALPAGNGKVFTLFSPKGGAGKSTLAVNLAVALARAHRDEVALLDLSLTFGHDPLLLNLSPKSNLSTTSAEALQKMDPSDLAYYLTPHPSSSLKVFPGSLHPEEGEAVTGETAKTAIEQLKRYFSYIVVDTGSYFTDPVLAALESADKLLIVASPEISTLQGLKETRRILDEVIHVPADRVRYLMNCVFPFKTLNREQFESALQQPIFMELPYGGEGPAKAALKGEALVETQSGSSLARAIQKLASQLTAEMARPLAVGAAEDRKRGFFR